MKKLIVLFAVLLALPAFGQRTLLSVQQGGTKDSTLGRYGVLLGNGTNPVRWVLPGTSGYVLTSNGSSAFPSWQAPPPSGVTSWNTRTGSVLPASGDYAVADITGLASALSAKANDNAVLHLAGTETVTGAKTFSALITGDISGNAGTVTNGVYTTGVGTVFLAPNGSAASLTGFPTLNQNTTGNAATATAVAFSGITTGTNATALHIGTGGSLDATGSGSITATAVPASGLTGATLASGVTGSSLTSLGTVTSGVWSATTVALNKGGTGSDLSATGGASQFLKQSSVGGAVTVAQVGGADLSLSDVTTNNTSTSQHGFAPKLDNVSTHYLSGTGAWTTPSGGSMTNPMTTTGDVVYSSDGSGTPARLGIGSSGQILTVSGGLPSYAANTGGWTVTKVAGSDFTTSSATLVDITGLTFVAAASTTYEIEAWVDALEDGTSSGMKFAVNSTGGSPVILAWIASASSSPGTLTQSALVSGVTVLNSANAEGLVYIRALVKSGTGTPTISIQCSKITSGLATIKVDGKLSYRIH